VIDWIGVMVSAVWILGLALLLATVSIASAFAQGKSLRSVLGGSSFRFALTVGGMLFASGMALSVETWWERAGWVVVIGLLLWDGVEAWRAARA
jgi:hypothetical protein